MNIVFVENSATSSFVHYSLWRGKMIYSAIKRTGLHNVSLIKSNDLDQNSQKALAACEASQIIVIEGSLQIDLLQVINHWKSKGKKVIVDVPIKLEHFFFQNDRTSEKTFSLTQMFSSIQKKDTSKVDTLDQFRWGLHLADYIMIASSQMQSHWQSSAPIKFFPEFVDIELLRDISKFPHDELIIGLFTNQSLNDDSLNKMLEPLCKIGSNVRWIPFTNTRCPLPSVVSSNLAKYPKGMSYSWPQPISLLDLCIVWDSQPVRGEFRTVIMDLLASRIPWAINDSKGYHEFSKYGLIIPEYEFWFSLMSERDHTALSHISNVEEGYLFAISHNIEDHTHEILAFFSEVLKN